MGQAAGVPRGVSAVRWKKVGLRYWSPASRKALGKARDIKSNCGTGLGGLLEIMVLSL